MTLDMMMSQNVQTPTASGHSRLLKKSYARVSQEKSFVDRSSKAAMDRKIGTMVASFLPTGLLDQLSHAVNDLGANPRVSLERPGVYLCLSLSGVHQMLELPIEQATFDSQLRQIFR